MAGFNPVLNPDVNNMASAVSTQYTQALQQPTSQFQLPMQGVQGQFEQTLGTLGNYNVDKLAQTAYNFYRPEIERTAELAQAQRNREYGSRGFGNSSSKALADIEGQRLMQQNLANAQDRAFVNAYQLAPQLQQAQTQQLGQLADIGYAQGQQDLQRLSTLGTQYGQLQNVNQSQQGLNIEADRLQQQLALARQAQQSQDANNAATLGLSQDQLAQNQGQFDMNAAMQQQKINNDLLAAQLAANAHVQAAQYGSVPTLNATAQFGG